MLAQHKEEENNNKKENCGFLKKIFLLIFSLSGLVIVHRAALERLEHISFFDLMLSKSWYI